jgi:heat shock protein HtpX
VLGAVGLKTHIWNNNLKSVLLLAGFPVLLLGLIYATQLALMGLGMLPSSGSIDGDLAGSAAMLVVSGPFAFAGAGLWFGVAAFSHQGIVDALTGSRKVSREEEPELYNLLENLCISRGMPMPRLRVIESGALNAYASGLEEKDAVIAVTRGLLDTLTREELECVLAHELTHVINRDTRLLVIATVFVGIISVLGEMIFRGLRHVRPSRRSSGKGAAGGAVLVLIALVAAAVAYVLAFVIRAAISRRREFLADAGAVELTKNPDAMISALRKISGRSALEAPDELRAMFFDNADGGWISLMATHPPIGRRIEALVRFAGGREALASPAPAAEAPALGDPLSRPSETVSA